ncbi:MAG: SufE family protein [Bacteroidetes bacterium]|nr:SufE family protein [Bacteroidota bacterium]
MTINEKQDNIIDELSIFDEWLDKYDYIIQLGKSLPLIDEKYKLDENLIKGCQSRVWLHAEMQDGKLIFTADSDALITKGLVSLVVEVLSGSTPQEIASADLYFIDRIGLHSHLSPTRSNGLASMIKQMKMYAIAFSKIK